jgi:hypothetical protein
MSKRTSETPFLDHAHRGGLLQMRDAKEADAGVLLQLGLSA